MGSIAPTRSRLAAAAPGAAELKALGLPVKLINTGTTFLWRDGSAGQTASVVSEGVPGLCRLLLSRAALFSMAARTAYDVTEFNVLFVRDEWDSVREWLPQAHTDAGALRTDAPLGFTLYERPGGGLELRTERYQTALEQGFRALREQNHSDMQQWLEEVGAVVVA